MRLAATVHGRPLYQNRLRKMNYGEARRVRRELQHAWREAWYDAADEWTDSGRVGLTLTEPICVHVHTYYRQANHRPDTDAVAPTVKAALDALVGLGMLADDSPDRVASITYYAPQQGEPGVTVVLTHATTP